MSTTTHITDDNGTRYNLPTGLTARNGNDSFRCDDCGKWEHAGDRLRHSKNCDTATLQPVAVKATKKTAATIADVEVPTVSEGGAIDWSQIRRGTKEHEAALYDFGQGGGNFDLI